jgi:hypothetical protein
MSETEELLSMFECGDFRCRVTKRCRLIVAPRSRLSPAYRLAIERHRDGLVRILCERDDPFARAAAKPIKRKENSMQRPDNQLPLFVRSDSRAKKQPPSSR